MKFLALIAILALSRCATLPPNPMAPYILGVDLHPPATSAACPGKCSIVRVDWNVPQYPDSYYLGLLHNNFRVQLITPYVPTGTAVTTQFIEQYANHVGTYAKEYCPNNPIWEIMNEPDDDTPLDQEQLTVAQYITLAETTATAIDANCPNATVITGGSSGLFGHDGHWPTEIKEVAPYVNGIGVHPYGATTTDIASSAAAIAQTFGKPVYFSEGPDDELLAAAAQGYAVEYVYYPGG